VASLLGELKSLIEGLHGMESRAIEALRAAMIQEPARLP
jgi:hypothetical protein